MSSPAVLRIFNDNYSKLCRNFVIFRQHTRSIFNADKDNNDDDDDDGNNISINLGAMEERKVSEH
jgi:hypothetical protein